MVEGKEFSRVSAIWRTYGSERAEIGVNLGVVKTLNLGLFWVILLVFDKEVDGAEGFVEKFGERAESAIEIGGLC